MDMKSKQVFLLKLLNHILQPVMYKDIEDIGKNFKIEDHVDFYAVIIRYTYRKEKCSHGFIKQL